MIFLHSRTMRIFITHCKYTSYTVWHTCSILQQQLKIDLKNSFESEKEMYETEHVPYM